MWAEAQKPSARFASWVQFVAAPCRRCRQDAGSTLLRPVRPRREELTPSARSGSNVSGLPTAKRYVSGGSRTFSRWSRHGRPGSNSTSP